MLIFRFDAPLFFANAEHFLRRLEVELRAQVESDTIALRADRMLDVAAGRIVDDVVVRGQRFIVVEVSPLSFNPVREEIVAAEKRTVGEIVPVIVERFIGILTEHFAGDFPLWLAPEQARVLSVSRDQHDYARQVAAELRDTVARGEQAYVVAPRIEVGDDELTAAVQLEADLGTFGSASGSAVLANNTVENAAIRLGSCVKYGRFLREMS